MFLTIILSPSDILVWGLYVILFSLTWTIEQKIQCPERFIDNHIQVLLISCCPLPYHSLSLRINCNLIIESEYCTRNHLIQDPPDRP